MVSFNMILRKVLFVQTEKEKLDCLFSVSDKERVSYKPEEIFVLGVFGVHGSI